MNADIIDRNESIGLIEPLLISESSKHRGHLNDLALELAMVSTGLKKSLPKEIVRSLSDLVRSMNCYYSNLIEGHNTHPIDIESALKGDYSSDLEKRNLQLEAKAHIEVQSWIDGGNLKGKSFTKNGIIEIHKRFCELLPDELLKSHNPVTNEYITVEPGQFRSNEVRVGHHIPVSPGSIGRFFDRFESAYSNLGRIDTILCAACAHHRFLYIHPFLDGNGRVARLMSHSALQDAIETGSLWSISRGLARNDSAYKSHLAACDLPRRNDYDGRGYLSEEALAGFATFFLKICLDQVSFMESLVQPTKLKDRIKRWAKEEIEKSTLPHHSDLILDAILFRGELSKSEAVDVVGKTDRQTRRITSALQAQGVITSSDLRSPFKIAFPAKLASLWMPGLFPEK